MIKYFHSFLLSAPGISILSMLACFCFFYIRSDRRTYKTLIKGVYYSLFLFVCYSFLSGLNYRIHSFQVWDFTSFYLWGKVAVQGYNFYLPENSQAVFKILNFQTSEDFSEFINAIVNVGFLYPPPTIFYFLPLGLLTYNHAMVAWMIFILVFLLGCIYLVYNQHFKNEQLNGLVLVIILFLIFPSVNETIRFLQTNFIVFFYLLWMRKYADSKYSGIILALAFFTKPYMLIFGIYFLLTKNWKSILYFCATSMVVSFITIAFFGFKTFTSYFTDNPAKRIPSWQFSEQINQSLHAVLLRANVISIDKSFLFILIIILILSFVLVLLFKLLHKKQTDLLWFLLLLTGLLIYPGTLRYYGVSLLFIVFQLFNGKNSIGLNALIIIPFVGLLYYLVSYSVFGSICFLLLFIVLSSLWPEKLNKLNGRLDQFSIM